MNVSATLLRAKGQVDELKVENAALLAALAKAQAELTKGGVRSPEQDSHALKDCKEAGEALASEYMAQSVSVDEAEGLFKECHAEIDFLASELSRREHDAATNLHAVVMEAQTAQGLALMSETEAHITVLEAQAAAHAAELEQVSHTNTHHAKNTTLQDTLVLATPRSLAFFRFTTQTLRRANPNFCAPCTHNYYSRSRRRTSRLRPSFGRTFTSY